MTAVRLREWLGGFGLSATFFLPIAAGLETDQRLFMWTWRHSAELLVAWLLLALLCTAALAILVRADRPRRAALALIALGLIPALSLVSSPGAASGSFRRCGAPGSTAPAGTAVVCVIAIAALTAIPAVAARAAAPLRVTALPTIPLAHFGLTAAVRRRDRGHGPAEAAPPRRAATSTMLLFDELSHGGLPRERHTLPNMHALAASATVYHHAIAPPPVRRRRA